jgi:hypothetical protein
VNLLDRLKAVKPPWAREKLGDGTGPAAAPKPASEPALPTPPPAAVIAAGLQDDESSLPFPLRWMIAGGVVVAAWLGWTVYATIDRGLEDGIGVLVAWPTLFAMAAIFLLPFIGIGWLLVRLLRGGDEAAEETEDDEDEEEPEEEEAEEEAEEEDEEDEEDDEDDDEEDEADDEAADPDEEDESDDEDGDSA